jgi:predicted nucleic acid-binding protein
VAASPPILSSTGSKPASVAKVFFDTNILLYLFSADPAKADRSEDLVAMGGIVSVQVLNEFASVAARKLGMSFVEIRDALVPIRALCNVVPLTLETHDLALRLAEHYGFSIYDALIAAAALQAGCDTLITEDLQDGQIVEGALTVTNPFAA